MTSCPICNNKRAIGKVGSQQYFCWDCCIEFIVRGEEITVYNVESDGTLTTNLDSLQKVM